MRTLLILAFVALPSLASAGPPPDPPPRTICFRKLADHTWERGAEAKVAAGLAFMEDLRKCDELLAAGVQSSMEYSVHQREAKIFANQSRFVITAYGVIWAVLLLFCVFMFLRQRKLLAQIGELEARLKADAAKS